MYEEEFSCAGTEIPYVDGVLYFGGKGWRRGGVGGLQRIRDRLRGGG